MKNIANKYKEEYIKAVLSLFFSVLLFCIISGFYLFSIEVLIPGEHSIVIKIHRNIIDNSEILTKVKNLTKFAPGFFKPEPDERHLFLLGLICFPIFLFISYYIMNRFFFKTVIQESLNRLYLVILFCSIGMLLLLLYLGLNMNDPYGHQKNAQFYFKLSSSYNHFFLYSIIIFPLIIIFLFSYQIKQRAESVISKVGSVIFYSSCFLLILLTFIISIFDVHAVDNSGKYTGHFNDVFYSVSQVFSGNALLIDGFTNIYGLYPHFLTPIFKLIGLNVLTFSIIMGLLVSASFTFIFLFLQKVIKNKIIIFLGFNSIVFLGWLWGKIHTQDYYFQYYPIRVFFPCLMLLLSSFYIKKRTKLFYYILFIICSVSILWNPDSGIIVFFAWLLFLCYLEFQNKDIKKIIRNIFFHTVKALLILFVTIFSFSLLIRLIYGSFPVFYELLKVVSSRATMGYFLLRMPLLHPWNIVILSYMIGIFLAIKALINRNISQKDTMIFLISILGAGIFSYYQGRSHNWNLVSVSYCFFILITLFADSLFEVLKKYKYNIYHIPILFSLLIYLLSFSSIDILLKIKYPTYELLVERYKIFSESKETQITRDIKFIKKYTSQGEKILILSGNQGVYFAESKTISAFNPGLTDLFFRKDQERLWNILQNTNYLKVFITPFNKSITSGEVAREIQRFYRFLSTDYEAIDNNGTMFLYQKKLI